MAVNSSSSSLSIYYCLDSPLAFSVSIVFIITHLSLLLPLSLLVFYLGLCRWQQQRSFATTSHSDIFTYNSAAIERFCSPCSDSSRSRGTGWKQEAGLLICLAFSHSHLLNNNQMCIVLASGELHHTNTMEVNSSSSSLSNIYHCLDSPVAVSISVAFNIISTCLHLPLSLLVFYLGLHRWRQQRSFATISHSDIFTYNSAAMELFYSLGDQEKWAAIGSGWIKQSRGLFTPSQL
ncbi:hypothetical protein Q8A73_012657 [Channa argus]|nr:hypothetical protein Q8A73_012657 [Channa argus]